MKTILLVCGLSILVLCTPLFAASPTTIPPQHDPAGYVARLLLNETPFPGERGYISEADSKATMDQILWVLVARLRYIPTGYTQQQIAAVHTQNIIDIITAGGQRGQVDGFYCDSNGNPTTVARVNERLNNLLSIANKGAPGKFARLIEHAVALANGYFAKDLTDKDRYAHLQKIGPKSVTGRAYSWMTDFHYYHPGGSFVRIDDALHGSLGGNRFYTLEIK